jgi:hypothetical protein
MKLQKIVSSEVFGHTWRPSFDAVKCNCEYHRVLFLQFIDKLMQAHLPVEQTARSVTPLPPVLESYVLC